MSTQPKIGAVYRGKNAGAPDRLVDRVEWQGALSRSWVGYRQIMPDGEPGEPRSCGFGAWMTWVAHEVDATPDGRAVP